MKDQNPSDIPPARPLSLHEQLLLLDLATEVLEGLEQLGVENRQELEELLERLERQVADSE
jgi:hypothetical protein